MAAFWMIAVVCCLLALSLPYAMRSLHPITVLFLWFLVAALEQLVYAIVIVNLNYVTQSGNAWNFACLKLVELIGVPLLAIDGIAAAFSTRLPAALRFAAWIVTPLSITMIYAYLFRQGVVIQLRWGLSYSIVKNFSFTIVYSLAAWGCQTLLRKKGLFA